MKPIARKKQAVYLRWQRRHVSRRLRQVIALIAIAAERRHPAEYALYYHLNRYQNAYSLLKRGRTVN